MHRGKPERDLYAHRDLWTADLKPTTAELGRLTEADRATRAELTDLGHVRLEQERLDWQSGLSVLGLG